MQYGLKEKFIEALKGVFAAHSEVERVILYGSRAKGNYEPYSDIDFTFVGAKLTFSLLCAIENEMDDLLLPYKIDASDFSTIENPDLVAHINRVGVIFYEKNILLIPTT